MEARASGWRCTATVSTALPSVYNSDMRMSHVLSSIRRPASGHKFDYFLLLDLEATCDAGDKKIITEIIEFPVLLVDGQSLEEVDRFHEFVKPRVTPVLTPFCTQLTGITQQTVDSAKHLPFVWTGFKRWMQKHELVDQGTGDACVQNLAFVTCGNWVMGHLFAGHYLIFVFVE